MMTRSSRASSPRTKQTRVIVAVAAAALVLAGVWLFSSAPRVKNADSRGHAVIAFGDSLTAGYGAAPGEDYPSKLSAMLGVDVVNAGVSGDTTDQALARIESDVLTRDPRLVIVGLGGNDFLQSIPMEVTETNLRAIVRQIQGRGAMVVLLGFHFPSLQKSYAKMYERVADEEGCRLVPDVLDGILRDPALKSDEIHPNGRGYALMAERIAPACRKLLEK